MEVLYHIRAYFVGIFPYIGLKHRPFFYGRYLQWIGSWNGHWIWGKHLGYSRGHPTIGWGWQSQVQCAWQGNMGSSKKHGKSMWKFMEVWEILMGNQYMDILAIEMRRLLTEIGFLAILGTSTVHKFPKLTTNSDDSTTHVCQFYLIVFRTNRKCR